MDMQLHVDSKSMTTKCNRHMGAASGNDISVLSKEPATNHAEATIIKNNLEEAECRAQSAAEKLHYELNEQVTCLAGNLVVEQLANKLLRKVQATNKDEISQLKATMLQKDHEATALKDKVATIKQNTKLLRQTMIFFSLTQRTLLPPSNQASIKNL